MKKLIKGIVVLLIVVGCVAAAWKWYAQRAKADPVAFKTARVTRGELLVSIDATGTLEPEEVVDVGAQVAGQILALGKDANGKTVDYGSPVEEGMVLAQIDEALLKADQSQADAQVKSAEAGVRRAEADLEQLKARFVQAERDWERAKKLGPSEALAQASYDGYESAYEVAKANIAVGEASILQAKAALTQAQTSQWRAKRNLQYSTITSPIKGIIIDRRVNIGQTVVASLNTPSLFLIARDLKRMQVWVAVNEADVARIYPGQPVTFSVDALPDETFKGEVVKVRPNASMTQNVVTYTVEIVTDNPTGKLFPYLTANVKFEVHRRENALLIPTAALRFTPTVEQVAPEFRDTASEGTSASAPASRPTTRPARANYGVVYALHGAYVKPIAVRLGLSNATMTEVFGDALVEGMELVTGTQTVEAAKAQATNPFTPKFPRRPPSGGRPPP